ncbi:MAG: peptidoglycan DD-metalloendopeptidase family protein [Sphingobacteriales bacterium]
MDASIRLAAYLETHPDAVGKVVDFNPGTDDLFHLDLTDGNKDLDAATIVDTRKFDQWVNQKLFDNSCKYGIGGYMEHRTIYKGIPLFENESDEPRFLHLGVDIWAKAGTAVYSPLQGWVHSFNDNNSRGDYGPAIIMEHHLEGLKLYSLYGHLSRKNLEGLSIGMPVEINQKIGEFGTIEENGHWPPHLHFQLMFDMEGKEGDYPGACRFSEKGKYLSNIPDPQLILNFPKAVS